MYQRFAPADIEIGKPLGLTPHGDWDPATEYWGEPGEPIHALCQTVIAAGARPSFEMEQVIPGADEDDWDSEPIIAAADLHHARHHREAIRILEDALAIDKRCIDARSHLGLVAFNTRGPGPAAELYQTGVAFAETSLPASFGGVLPWGWTDNRPFLRCLHGLALCAWRQRRWNEAEAMFIARVWLDPSGAFNDLACLEPVRARQRWTKASRSSGAVSRSNGRSDCVRTNSDPIAGQAMDNYANAGRRASHRSSVAVPAMRRSS